MKTRRGHNQYKAKYGFDTKTKVRIGFCLLFIAGVVYSGASAKAEAQWFDNVIAPCPEKCAGSSAELHPPVPTPTPMTLDAMIDKYAMKYGSTKWIQLRTKALLHAMLLHETAYGNTTKCGDQGLSCGPLQFREPTYNGFRKEMIKKGLVEEMGSRFDLENSIDTAAYMVATGHEDNWGPVLRGEVKL